MNSLNLVTLLGLSLLPSKNAEIPFLQCLSLGKYEIRVKSIYCFKDPEKYIRNIRKKEEKLASFVTGFLYDNYIEDAGDTTAIWFEGGLPAIQKIAFQKALLDFLDYVTDKKYDRVIDCRGNRIEELSKEAFKRKLNYARKKGKKVLTGEDLKKIFLQWKIEKL